MKNRFLISTLTVSSLILGGTSMAQSSADNEALLQTRLELQQSAQRLSLLAQIPEEARPEAEALLERAETIHNANLQLEVQHLEALVAELESGATADEANQAANDQFATAFAEIETMQESLLNDLQSFQEAHPEALGNLGFFRGGQFGERFGANPFGQFSMNPFGQGGWPNMGSGPTFGHFGMNDAPFLRDGDNNRGFGFPWMRMR